MPVPAGAEGAFALAGYFHGTFAFGATSTTVTGRGAFLAIFDPTGQGHAFVAVRGNSGTARGVAIDGAGRVVVVGENKGGGEPTFGGVPFQSSLGMSSGFIAKTDADGRVAWVKGIVGVAGDAYARRVAIDGSRRVAITGSFNGLLDLGAGIRLAGAGGSSFVLSLDP